MSAPDNTSAEQFLIDELAAARSSLKRTQVIGLLVLVAIVAYMGVVTMKIREALVPVQAADLAKAFIAERVTAQADELSDQVKQHLPAWVAGLPDYVIKQLPAYRLELEKQVEASLKDHGYKVSQELGTKLDGFLQANIVQVKAVLKAGQDRSEFAKLEPEIDRFLADYLNSRMGGEESLQAKLDKTLHALRDIKKMTDRLASAPDLTSQEKQARHAIAIIGRTADAQVKALQQLLKAQEKGL